MKFLKKVLFLLLIIGLLGTLVGYFIVSKNNIKKDSYTVFVSKSWTIDSLSNFIKDSMLINTLGFDVLADKMNLKGNVYPGKYEINAPINTYELIRFFRSAQQTDVNLILQSHLHRSELLGAISNQLECSEKELNDYLINTNYLEKKGFTKENWPVIFIANTYKFRWASSPKTVFKRFFDEYSRFWDAERKGLLLQTGLDEKEVFILASIVEGETTKGVERPIIAGVYLNRLAKKWPLQADPTIMYIIRYDNRKRVLKKDTEIDHPYNTYLIQGLPPGPIMQPSILAIDAVLDPVKTKHNYMFFCANSNFDGSHIFATNLRQHNVNAVKYRRAMNRAKIMR